MSGESGDRENIYEIAGDYYDRFADWLEEGEVKHLQEKTRNWSKDERTEATNILLWWFKLADDGLDRVAIEEKLIDMVLRQYEKWLRAVDAEIQRECAINPPSGFAKAWGDPCRPMFNALGASGYESVNFLRRKLRVKSSLFEGRPQHKIQPHLRVYDWYREYRYQTNALQQMLAQALPFVILGGLGAGISIVGRTVSIRAIGRPVAAATVRPPKYAPVSPPARTASGQIGGGKAGASPKQLPRLSQSTRAQVEALMKEHPGLTKVNAERAVKGLHGGSSEVLGSGGRNDQKSADVSSKRLGQSGVERLPIEVKVINGKSQSTFNEQVSKAVSQTFGQHPIRGEVHVQMPEGTDAVRLILRFRGARADNPAAGGRLRSTRIIIADPSGKILFDGPLFP